MIVFLCIALGIIAGGMGYCLLRRPLMVISVKSGNFTVSRRLFQIKTIFLIIGILFLTISGILSITQRDEMSNTDRIYILDISESMLTEDMGDLSRLEYAKRLILRDLSPNITS